MEILDTTLCGEHAGVRNSFLEGIVRKNRVFFLTLSVAMGAVFAQDSPPTGVVRGGAIELIRSSSKFSAGPLGTINTTTDTLAGGFSMIDYSKLLGTDPPAVTTIGSCSVVLIKPPQGTPDPTAITILDAGPVLNLTGPNGSKQIAATEFAFGAMLGGGTSIPGLPPPPPLYLDPGPYTVDNGGGGADIGPFKATLTIPTQFVWTNSDASASIDRSAGLDVAWTGGDPDSKVTIAGGVVLINADTRQVASGAVFTCTETNSAGHFFVPPEVLTLLPASTIVNNTPNGSLTVNNGVTVKFDAPSVDQSTFTFTSGALRIPEYK